MMLIEYMVDLNITLILLLWCFQVPLENKSIFSGMLLQYMEENKKWRNRFLFVPDSYKISYYESKQVTWIWVGARINKPGQSV